MLLVQSSSMLIHPFCQQQTGLRLCPPCWSTQEAADKAAAHTELCSPPPGSCWPTWAHNANPSASPLAESRLSDPVQSCCDGLQVCASYAASKISCRLTRHSWHSAQTLVISYMCHVLIIACLIVLLVSLALKSGTILTRMFVNPKLWIFLSPDSRPAFLLVLLMSEQSVHTRIEHF